MRGVDAGPTAAACVYGGAAKFSSHDMKTMRGYSMFNSAARPLTRLSACAAVTAAIAAASATTAGGEGEAHAAATCPATPVHYAPRKNVGTRAALTMPWVVAAPRRSHIIGYLFYYGRGSALVARRKRGLIVYTRGRTPDGEATRIMWTGEKHVGNFVTVTGRRLDARGSFRTRVPDRGGAQFITDLHVPRPGCWRLTMRSYAIFARVTFRAINSR